MEDTGFSYLRVVGSFIVTKDIRGMRHDKFTLSAKLEPILSQPNE